MYKENRETLPQIQSPNGKNCIVKILCWKISCVNHIIPSNSRNSRYLCILQHLEGTVVTWDMPALGCEHPLRKDTYTSREIFAFLTLPNKKYSWTHWSTKISSWGYWADTTELKAPQMLQTLFFTECKDTFNLHL